MEIYASLPTKWTLRVNFKRDEKISFLLTRGMRVKRKTTLRKVYRSTIIPLCRLLSLYRDVSHGLLPREETRLLFTVARLFRTAGENAVKFPSLEIYALPPRTARTNFSIPLYLLFFVRKKMWQTYARTIRLIVTTRFELFPKIYLSNFRSSCFFQV